jgi:hypothetical protein
MTLPVLVVGKPGKVATIKNINVELETGVVNVPVNPPFTKEKTGIPLIAFDTKVRDVFVPYEVVALFPPGDLSINAVN